MNLLLYNSRSLPQYPTLVTDVVELGILITDLLLCPTKAI